MQKDKVKKMNKITLSIGSVTQSIKAQKILSEHSIPSKVVKISSDNRGRGCIYGLDIDGLYNQTAIVLLDKYKIKYHR